MYSILFVQLVGLCPLLHAMERCKLTITHRTAGHRHSRRLDQPQSLNHTLGADAVRPSVVYVIITTLDAYCQLVGLLCPSVGNADQPRTSFLETSLAS